MLLPIIAFLLSQAALADTAWYYNTERSGEGVVVTTTDDGRLAFAYFTQTGSSFPIPPQVSPPPPVSTQIACQSSPIWFTGVGVYADGAAIGELRYDVPIADYPQSKDNRVSKSLDVGVFLMEKTETGFRLVLETNHVLPNLSVFNRVYEFDTLLTK